MNVSKRHWLTASERWLLIGSGLGTVASLLGQNAALASAPLTALAAVGLLNRHKTEAALEDSQKKLFKYQRRQASVIQDLSRQVTALPSPEALNHFQRSVMKRSNRNFLRLTQEIKEVRDEFHRGLETLPSPDLSPIYRNIAQLEDQYAHAAAAIEHLNSSSHRAIPLTRMEAAEQKLAQVNSEMTSLRVNIETLQTETRTTVSGVQEGLTTLENYLNSLPWSAHPESFKTELSEVVGAISNLVTRTEFTNLVEHLKTLVQRQSDLEQEIIKFSSSSTFRGLAPSDASYTSPTVGANSTARPVGDKALRVDLDHLNAAVRQLQRQVKSHESASDTREDAQAKVSLYLGQLKGQLSHLEGITQSLVERQNQLTQRLDAPAPSPQETLTNRKALIKLAKQLRNTQQAIKQLQHQQPAAGQAEQKGTLTDWMVDIPTDAAASNQETKLSSRRALEMAIDQAQRRLYIVWPWSSAVTMDEDLLQRFTRLLERGCHLDIGWCHQGDPQEGRLIGRISQRWATESNQLVQLKSALNMLLPLRENYPNHFRFKVMGTAESFLVCDNSTAEAPEHSFAILSLQALPTQNRAFPTVEMKVRSYDPQVVQGLIQRFRNPAIAPDDTRALFNRGTTRHDLRDQPGAISDYSQVLSLQPDHAVVLNNRGAAQFELNNIDAAEIDFTEALAHNPKLFAAYCNRGWLRLEQNRLPAAVADFTEAITLKPNLPMAYVYRGSALQKLGDLKGAVRDYSDAIACGEPLALPYCYRSAAYQSQGDRERAIADLETASARLAAQGDHHILSSVQRQLNRLQLQTPHVNGANANRANANRANANGARVNGAKKVAK
jgi:tetratricopeptide (TPR) repeat protein